MNSISNRHHSNLRFKLSSRNRYDFQLVDDVSDLRESSDYGLLINFQPVGSVLENTIEWGETKLGDLSGINHFGLTGLDNGYFPFTGNYEDTIGADPGLTTKLTLKKVDGYTDLNIKYDAQIVDGELQLQGGFYQGIYKLEGYDYQVLPEVYENGWTISVDLMRTNEVSVGLSLNSYASQRDRDTAGFFFYTGTRAENKYWNQFNPEGYTGTTEAAYDGIRVVTTKEEVIIPLPPPRVVIRRMDNQFLIYGRSSGHKICTKNNTFTFGTHRAEDLDKGDFENEEVFITYSGATTFDSVRDINAFLYYGRSSGKPVCGDEDDHIDATVNGVNYDYGTKRAEDDINNDNKALELNPDEDLSGNALGFRITPAGEFTYRRIIKRSPCVEEEMYFILEETDDYMVIEESTEGLALPMDEYFNITVKWDTDIVYNCAVKEPRMGNLYLYVDGFLKKVFPNFEEVINTPLSEYKDKQLGVPYNISIGGGTQGLLENMTFGGTDPEDRGRVIERYFAGSFIGNLKNFRLYQEPLNWCDLKNIVGVNS